MIGRLLETGKLQHAVPHLAQAKARDAEDLAFVRHHVGEELHVARIDVHVAHHEADFVDDGFARGFDAQNVAHLRYGIGLCGEAVDTLRCHACSQAVAFDQQGIPAAVVGFDDGTRGFRVAADGNVR